MARILRYRLGMQIPVSTRAYQLSTPAALEAAPLPFLRLLEDSYLSVGAGASPAVFPNVVYPHPHAAMSTNAGICGAGYAHAGCPLGSAPMSMRAFDRLMTGNSAARGAFEQSVGGSIAGYSQQGTVMIRPFPPGAFPTPLMAFGSSTAVIAGSLATMAAAATVSASNPWHAMMLGGLAASGAAVVPAVLGGAGMGSWNPAAMPGRINNTNPVYETMHQAQIAGVLMDPSLTVEDKVTLMIMMIMNKMDKDIERQANYVNSIQQQQSNRGKKGGKKSGGGKGVLGIGKGKGKSGGGGDSSPSIDVETMKLKRMVDKRGQMFDMLRQIVDKYNETAKGIIQSIGR